MLAPPLQPISHKYDISHTYYHHLSLTGDCHTGFSLYLCTPATESVSRVGDSVTIDSVKLYSDDDSCDGSSVESIYKEKTA